MSDEVETLRVSVVISSLGNERRTISLGELDKEAIGKLIGAIDATFGTVRSSGALMLTDANGTVVFANLDNTAFVEVQIG